MNTFIKLILLLFACQFPFQLHAQTGPQFTCGSHSAETLQLAERFSIVGFGFSNGCSNTAAILRRGNELSYCNNDVYGGDKKNIFCFQRMRIRLISQQDVIKNPFDNPEFKVESGKYTFAYPERRLMPQTNDSTPVREIKSIRYAATVKAPFADFVFGWIQTDDFGVKGGIYLAVIDLLNGQFDTHDVSQNIGLVQALEESRRRGGIWINSERYKSIPTPPLLAMPPVNTQIPWKDFLRVRDVIREFDIHPGDPYLPRP